MFRSLRFRLPALFFAGIVLPGVLAVAIAFRLFQDYTQDQARRELRQEAKGLTQLYVEPGEQESGAEQAAAVLRGEEPRGRERRPAVLRRPPVLLRAAIGARAVAAEDDRLEGGKGHRVSTSCRPVSRRRSWPSRIRSAEDVGRKRSHRCFGSLIVATPQTELRDRLVTLLERLALALLVGVAITTGLAWYLSGRITRPVRSACEGSGRGSRGSLRRRVADRAGARRDRRPCRFVQADGLTTRRGRGAGAELPDDRLPRAPDAADGDPRPR